MTDLRLPGYAAPLAHVPRFGHGSRVPGWDEAADLDRDPAEVPDPATTTVPQDLRAQIEAHMANYPDRRSAALPALAAAQRVHGWCSPTAIDQVACVMRLTPGYLVSVATFYDMLETTPPAREGARRCSVYVCTNISCSLLGADELYAAVQQAATGPSPTGNGSGSDDAGGGEIELNVRSFECLGACDIAPMASVDGVYVGPLTLQDVEPMLADIRAGRAVLPAKQLARRPGADPSANRSAESWSDASPPAPQPSGGVAAQPGSALGTSPAATPDIDPAAALFGPPMGEDRPGPSAPHEQSHRQPSAPSEEPPQAHSDQDIPHQPPEPGTQAAGLGQEDAGGARDSAGAGQGESGGPGSPPAGAGRPPRGGWRGLLGRNRGQRRGSR